MHFVMNSPPLNHCEYMHIYKMVIIFIFFFLFLYFCCKQTKIMKSNNCNQELHMLDQDIHNQIATLNSLNIHDHSIIDT